MRNTAAIKSRAIFQSAAPISYQTGQPQHTLLVPTPSDVLLSSPPALKLRLAPPVTYHRRHPEPAGLDFTDMPAMMRAAIAVSAPVGRSGSWPIS